MTRDDALAHLKDAPSLRALGELLDHCLKFYDLIRDSDDRSDMVNAMSMTIGRHGNARSMRRLSSASNIPGDIGHTALTEAIHGAFRSRATLANRILLKESGDFYRQLATVDVPMNMVSADWHEGLGRLLDVYRQVQSKNRELERVGQPDTVTAQLVEAQIGKLETIERERLGQPAIMPNLAQMWDIFRDARQLYQRVATDARDKQHAGNGYNHLSKIIGSAMEPIYQRLSDELHALPDVHLSLKHGTQSLHIAIPNNVGNPIHSDHTCAQILVGLLSGRGLLDTKKMPERVSASMQQMGQTTVIVEQWEAVIAAVRHALEAQGIQGAELQSILAQNGLGFSRDDMEVVRKACRNSAQEMAFLERYGLAAFQNNEIQGNFGRAVHEVRAFAQLDENPADSLASTRSQAAFLCRVILRKLQGLARDLESKHMLTGSSLTNASYDIEQRLLPLHHYYSQFVEESGGAKPSGIIMDRAERPYLAAPEELPDLQDAIAKAHALADQLAAIPDKTGIGSQRRAADINGIIDLLGESLAANRNVLHERQVRGASVA